MAMAIARLPQEIITDILSRLPAKSIGQFRCVSRPWRSLLCDPEFLKTQLNRQSQSHDIEEKLLLLSTSRSLFTLTFSGAAAASDGVLRKLNLPRCQDNWVNVVGSCNGLALVIDEEESKYLINPTTFQHLKLSNSPEALDPSISFSMHGFGYDSVNDDYKIVTLSYFDTDNEHEPDCADTFIDIYSSKMGSWKRLGPSPYDHAVPYNDSGKFLNGSLHWLASSRTNGYASVIAAFNLAHEVFDELPPPASLDKDKFVFNKLMVLGGCLYMVDDHFHDHVDVWVMKEYGVGESWTKFSINGIENDDPKPLCSFGDEKLVVLDCAKLKVKNLKEETSCRDMVIDGMMPVEFQDGVPFRESLVSPKFLTVWNQEQSSSQSQD
ncbi:hypothetical protein M9H77_06065 [Catharanthus roseus]|uniref:Uncharacterized protein n=1 Tax=Catharanthus roseus TaxID=4058 RepID=A0ACC0BR25_CATRO|nr:hypothetical protein M9H77_06065 [Catharanthus roseus]